MTRMPHLLALCMLALPPAVVVELLKHVREPDAVLLEQAGKVHTRLLGGIAVERPRGGVDGEHGVALAFN